MKSLQFKSLILMGAMLAATMVTTSCSDGDDDDPTPTLSVSNSSLSVEAGGGSMNVTVSSNSGWYVSSGASWCSVSPQQGTGNGVVYVTTSENTSTSSRNCTLTVITTDGSLSQTVQITQSGLQASLTADKSVSLSSEKGASNTFAITSNVSWSLSGKPEWLTVTPLNGNGNATVTVTTLSANETAEERSATLTVTAGDQTATVTVTQAAGLSSAKVVPADMLALYDQICFEWEGEGNPHKFYYDIYTKSSLNLMSDKEIIADLEKGDERIFEANYIVFPSGFSSNTTYYVCSIAYDDEGNRGALVKTPVTTLKYYDYNQDAYASLSMSWYDSDYDYIAFTFTKQAYCDKYHAIYGTNISSTKAEYNRVLYAFQINYYLKHGTMHWFSKNWNLTIQTNYPNDHSFVTMFDWTSSYGAIVAYSWGIFQNGDLSSDVIGGYADLYSSSSSSKKIVQKRTNAQKSTGIIYDYTTLSKERQLKASMAKMK